ncbi:hypothetical protein FS749_010518 [Ceratobasidium sp. UAMH 11750]|nr:hypothetical protein FS749_010518 [Ceratobasidium sp. UAMH 11750]
MERSYSVNGPEVTLEYQAAGARTWSEARYFRGPAKDFLKSQENLKTVLEYPEGERGALRINRMDLGRLNPGGLLNDTLVELGLKIWLGGLRARDPKLAHQVHVFNSFFFEKLKGQGRGCNYDDVKRWTSKFDLFKKKFIIVPIHEKFHWYLAIVCFPRHALHAPPTNAQRRARGTLSRGMGATIGAASQRSLPADNDVIDIDTTDEESDDKQHTSGCSQKCWILVLDSLGGKHEDVVRVLRAYLQAEAQERRGKRIETKTTKLSGGLIEDRHLPVPIQPNGYDCGLYLLHNVETFISNPLELLGLPARRPTRKQSIQISLHRKLWREKEALKKRDSFRHVVKTLSANWQRSKSKHA